MRFVPDAHGIPQYAATNSTLTGVIEHGPSRGAAIEDVMNALPAQAALLDRHGTILAVNDAWKDVPSHQGTPGLADGVVGMDYVALSRRASVPSREGARSFEAGIRAVLDGTQPLFTARYSSGISYERRWSLLQVRALPPGMGGALVLHLDITQQDRAERKLAEILPQAPLAQAEFDHGLEPTLPPETAEHAKDEARLRAMLALTDTALSHLTIDDLLRELLDRVRAVMGVDNVAILLLDAAGEMLTIQAAQGPEEEMVGEVKIPVGQGVAGRIAASRKPLKVDDLSTFNLANKFLRQRLRSVVGVPLIVDDRLVGVVHVGSAAPRQFTEDDVQLLQLAADRIALSVDRAYLYAAEREARARVEEALAHSAGRAEQLQTILETIADGVAVTDMDGRIIQTNRAYRELFATDRMTTLESLLPAERNVALKVRGADGRPVRGKQSPEMRALHGEVVGGSAADFQVRSLDGRELKVNISAASLRNHKGSIEGAALVVQDVTWRKRLERERKEAHANELASHELTLRMDEFLATASHDLRAPLTVAVGTTDLAAGRFERLVSALSTTTLQDPIVADKIGRVRDCLEQASQSLSRLSQLVKVLFDISRAHTGTLELRRRLFDLAKVVGEQVEAARMAFPNRMIHLVSQDQAPLRVLADPDRIGEVVMNYLINALKYSAEGQPVVVRFSSDGLAARVSVRDCGPGIPRGEQKRIWQRFYRARSRRVRTRSNIGLGLGLHICKTIVEAHGGQVGIASSVGVGSTFWFTLPLVVPQA